MPDHPPYVDELDELVDSFDHANVRESLEEAILKGKALERAEWKIATECDTPADIEKVIAVRYEWLHSWQDWGSRMLKKLGRQVKYGFHGDSQARAILGARLEESRGAPTTDDDMCPNCVTPWKCNGPHIPDDQDVMVTITINGKEHEVQSGIRLDYDTVVKMDRGKVIPYLTVVFKGPRGDGSLWQGGPPTTAGNGMYITAIDTGNA